MDTSDIEQYLKPDTDTIGNIEIRKPTAGTLSLCDFAKLKIASGGATSVPFYEAIAFFYIHSQPLDVVRKLVFDFSEGRDESGCSLKFTTEVIAWGDTVELGSIGQMGEKIASLLQEALTPKIESAEDSKTEDEVSAVLAEIDPKKK